MGRISLYYYTIKNLKPTQVLNRIRIRFGSGCPLGVSPSNNINSIRKVESPKCLDFDPVFLSRFSVEELMEDVITILHSSKSFDWKTKWYFDDKSALWNFNLHYFEFLFPMVKAWKETGDRKYLNKTMEVVSGWIDSNPIDMYPAWSSYTTALRIVTWISYFGYVSTELPMSFKEKFLQSLHDQYVYLSFHLEKDILGNHYFEDLKSLVLASIFFNDEDVLKKALSDFKAECKEEILSDGMHFELSPMYHKIIFEGMLRVTIALRYIGRADSELETYLQSMLDVACSFENGLNRIPLFNDGGNNVSKSLSSLAETAKLYFNIMPQKKTEFCAAGYYIFNKDVVSVDGHNRRWRLIVDSGLPGPKYIPGHSHCDAMSYELFCDEKPVVFNCGTYAYQCKERFYFRSTEAHNTVMVENIEQSEIWDAFRLARRSHTGVVSLDKNSITMKMKDQRGNIILRKIQFTDSYLIVTDKSDKQMKSFVHTNLPIHSFTAYKTKKVNYSVDYGKMEETDEIIFYGNKVIEYKIQLL